MNKVDTAVIGLDRALRTIFGVQTSSRPNPSRSIEDGKLSESERRASAGFMRVNHVGEVCAQALYEAQSQFSRSALVREQLRHSAKEEEDHLSWTADRLSELNSRPSYLNPAWYAGAFVLGSAAAIAGDRWSLGFVVETERQVEAHLKTHLEKLPAADLRSRAVVAQMVLDERAHGEAASKLGASNLPLGLRSIMSLTAKIMTSVAYYI